MVVIPQTAIVFSSNIVYDLRISFQKDIKQFLLREITFHQLTLKRLMIRLGCLSVHDNYKTKVSDEIFNLCVNCFRHSCYRKHYLHNNTFTWIERNSQRTQERFLMKIF